MPVCGKQSAVMTDNRVRPCTENVAMHCPNLPVPPPLRGSEPDSFAAHTITHRLPQIARRILEENTLPDSIITSLKALIAEIPHQTIRPLPDQNSPDMPGWYDYITPQVQNNWLQVPWFFAETYFYRRIMALVEFFQTGFDPFAWQKQHSLDTTVTRSRVLAAQGDTLRQHGWRPEGVIRLLMLALWGNQADMSMWSADDVHQPLHTDTASQQAHLLVNDATAVVDLLTEAPPPRRVDIILDNAGFELVGDLCLVDYLLSTGHIQEVRMHLKLHPTFVSDATVADVQATTAFLAQDSDAALQTLGARLTAHLAAGRLQLHRHAFWTSPLPLWHMPEDLRQAFTGSALAISKGDANYRRALGDAHWPFTTPVTDVVAYFPAPIVFLRTCKAQVMVGLSAAQVQAVSGHDPDWLINGEWGVIQLVRRLPRIP